MKDTHSLAPPDALNATTLFAPVSLIVFLALLQAALAWLPAGPHTALLVERVFDTALGLAGIWLTVRLIDLLIWDRLLPHWLGIRAPRLLRQFVAVLLVLLGIAVLLGRTWGLALSAVLATTGVLGIVLGLALRNILADFFSGIALNIEKPFDLGDFVVLRARGQRNPFVGTVREVNWRSTRLLTPEDNLVSVPNSVVAAAIVENLSYPSPVSEMEVDLTLPWDVPQAQAERVLSAACTEAWALGATGGDRPPKVRLTKLDGSGATWRVVYLLDPRLRGKGSALHLLLHCLQRHLRLAGLHPSGLGSPLQGNAMPVAATLPQRQHDHTLAAHRDAVLAEVALLQSVSVSERTRLAQGVRVLSMGAGQVAVREGEPGDSMFVVAEGVLEVQVGDSGDRQRANVLGAGGVFGEMALLTGEPRTATVAALSPTVLYELDRSMLAPLMGERSGIVDDLAAVVARNRQRDQTRLDNQPSDAATELVQQGFVKQLAARIRVWLGAR